MALAFVGLTAACNGGSSEPRNAFAFSSVDQLGDLTTPLFDGLDRARITPRSGLPTTGQARYDGIAIVAAEPLPFVQTQAEDIVFGTARVNVDFADGRLSGHADRFRNGADERVDGRLVIESARITDRGGVGAIASLSGDIEFGSGTLEIDGRLSSSFVDPRGQRYGGVIDATGTDGRVTRELEGLVLTQRQ